MRVLIVPLAGLVENWEHEMHSLFHLPFRVVTGGDARQGNPFCGTESDLVLDTDRWVARWRGVKPLPTHLSSMKIVDGEKQRAKNLLPITLVHSGCAFLSNASNTIAIAASGPIS